MTDKKQEELTMTRLALQLGLLALSCFGLDGCNQPSSYSSYSVPSSNTNSTPTAATGSPTTTEVPTTASNVGEPTTAANTGAPAPAGNYDPAPSGFTRPALAISQGQYFKWAMPIGWRAYESGNGVDLTSPDGRYFANSTLLTGSWGQTTPWNFLVSVLNQIGARNINGLSTVNLPWVPSGYPNVYWQVQEFELTLTDSVGWNRHADCTVAICNAYGGYSALLQSFSAPINEWEQARTWLPVLAQSIIVTNMAQVAYRNQLIPVRNRPLDNSGLMESWQQRRLSQDRIAKAQREGMMGYERLVSAETGKYYNMPLETYDGTVGGYRNPEHPNEILKPTQPGE
jgi:hypothetical protein